MDFTVSPATGTAERDAVPELLDGVLVAELPELGRLSRRPWAALVGVAPPQSRQWTTTRPAPHLGRPRLRPQDPVHGHRNRHPLQPRHP